MLLLLWFLPFVAASPITLPDEELTIQSRNTEYLLPKDQIEVDFYKILLKVPDDFTLAKFTGEAEISFKNLKPTSTIQLHARNLQLTVTELTDSSGSPIDIVTSELNNVTDILTLTAASSLSGEANYHLRFEYDAELQTDEMYGFYRSEYIDESGETRFLGTTQFQPVHARRVFPCFDEPIYKATFDISIEHLSNYNAVANAKLLTRDESEPGYILSTFTTTPRMSTYLIAFVVSDFTCSENQIQNDITHHICSRNESSDTRALALGYGPKLTWSLEQFTGIKYEHSTLTKLHQFAIPDFAAGAMENWGLITYRERYLLWDPQDSSNRYKQNVITIEAHELAHFWFGNLVTCNWWSDTFLNEGFATYFEYHTAQDVDASLETDKQFVIEQLQPVLVSDASPNSAPLSYQVYTPAQISGRFSSISYNKGGSIFRMVQHFMGLENFKKGINNYLSVNQFGSTKPEDLWSALNTFATGLPNGLSLSTVMKNWVTQAGYPVLNVSLEGNKYTVTQKRFLSSGESSFLWFIPLSYTADTDMNKFQDTSARAWFQPIGGAFTGYLPNISDWIIFNNQQTGYYRVDYEPNLFAKIKAALNQPGFSGIHELNRAQIIDDFYNFARYGYKSFADLLSLFEFLEKETSYYVWYSAFGAISNMVIRTSNEQLLRSLSSYVLKLSGVFYNSLPFNEAKDDNHIYTLSKVLVIPWSCRLGLQDCIDNSLEAFASYRANSSNKPDKNLRSVIYCNGLRHSGDIQSDWEFLWNEFQSTKLSSEQVTILSALGCAKDEAVLRSYLSMSINETSGIRRQDALSVFSAVYGGNPEGVDVALDFLLENYPAVSDYYGAMNSLNSLFAGIAARFTRQEQIDKLEAFIAANDLGEYQAVAQSALNTAKSNLVWIEKFERELNLYFAPKEEGSTDSSNQIFISCSVLFVIVFGILFNF